MPDTIAKDAPALASPQRAEGGVREATTRLIGLVQRIFGASMALVSLEGPDGAVVERLGELPEGWNPYGSGDSPLESESRIVFADDVLEKSALKGEQVLLDVGARSFAQVPMWSSKGQRLGFLWVGCTEPREWTRSDLRILEGLAAGAVAEAELWMELRERRDVEEALRRSEASFRLLVEGVRDYAIFMVDPSGHVVSWNQGAQRIFGYADQEVLLKPASVFQPDTESAMGRSDEELLRSALEHGQAEDEAWRVRKSGTPFWAKVRVTALKDVGGALMGYSIVVRDLTERRESQDELHEREAILEAVGFAADRFLRKVDWSEMLQQVLARLGSASAASRVFVFQNYMGDDDELRTGQRFEWCGPEVQSQKGNSALQDLRYATSGFKRWQVVLGRGEVIHGNVRDFPPTERPLLEGLGARSLAVLPIFVDNEWWGFLGLEDDRRERRWSSVILDVLKTAADTIGNAVALRDQASASDEGDVGMQQRGKLEAVGRLAGGIAHDFNNLLTAIRGNVELLLEDFPANDPRQEELAEIRASARRASELTGQLLAFGRRQILKPQVIDPADVIRDMGRFLRRLIDADVPVDIQLDEPLWPIRVDRTQLDQVLMNLVLNARDALPERGGRIEIRASNATLGKDDPRRRNVMKPGKYLCISVLDNGSGMTEDIQAQVFEPFFTTKPVGEGTGLGLATVYGIVKQSGGYIWVDSAPGAGSTFSVFLPREKETSEMSDSTSEEADMVPEGGHETLLLVEDENVVRRLAKRVLERQGYQVLEAANGHDALAVLDAHGRPVDLLVTDMVMPEMGGRELAQAVAARQKDIRVLYMSGYTADEVFRQALPSARNRFLQKPFAPDDLTAKVREILDVDDYNAE